MDCRHHPPTLSPPPSSRSLAAAVATNPGEGAVAAMSPPFPIQARPWQRRPLMCPAVRFGEARPQSSRDRNADPSAGMGVASVANGIEGRDYFVVKVGEAAADWEPGCEHGSSSPWRRRPWRLDVKQPHLPVVEACRPCDPFFSRYPHSLPPITKASINESRG